MPEPVFEKDQYFVTKNLNHVTKKFERTYFKILSIRFDKEKYIQGFRVQRYEFKHTKTIIVPIDDGKDKKLKKQDVYNLQPNNEKPIYYKYNLMHWLNHELYKGCDRLLNNEELTKYIDT